VDGVVYPVLIKQGVVGVDWLVLVVVYSFNHTLIVTAHVDTRFGIDSYWKVRSILLEETEGREYSVGFGKPRVDFGDGSWDNAFAGP